MGPHGGLITSREGACVSSSLQKEIKSVASALGELSELEVQSTREYHAFISSFLELLSDHFGGDTTVNHLRIGSYIGLRSQHQKTPTSHKEITEALHISRPTVSRIVKEFVDIGWVARRPDDNDGRKQLLEITPDHEVEDCFERDFRILMNGLLNSFAAGRIVMVDPGKRSF